MDVIVADEEQPFQVKINDPAQLMIIEGVSAAAEVKTTLTNDRIAGLPEERASASRPLKLCWAKLQCLPRPRYTATLTRILLRFYHHRPFFAFAYEGAIDSETLIEMLSEDERSGEHDVVPSLDAVFILDKGFALNLWDGNGAFRLQSETQEMVTGWYWFGDPDRTLLGLLLWLHTTMPRFAIRSSPMLGYLFPVPRPLRQSLCRERNQRRRGRAGRLPKIEPSEPCRGLPRCGARSGPVLSYSGRYWMRFEPDSSAPTEGERAPHGRLAELRCTAMPTPSNTRAACTMTRALPAVLPACTVGDGGPNDPRSNQCLAHRGQHCVLPA